MVNVSFLEQESNLHNIAKNFIKDRKNVAKERDFASITIRVNAISINDSTVTERAEKEPLKNSCPVESLSR